MPTARISAIPAASRIPVAMNGAADGRETRQMTASRPKPNVRMVSRATGSTSCRP